MGQKAKTPKERKQKEGNLREEQSAAMGIVINREFSRQNPANMCHHALIS